jgi:hypothetical protein
MNRVDRRVLEACAKDHRDGQGASLALDQPRARRPL